VECVLESGMSIIKAAKRLKIKQSTAKLILNKFKEEGTFFEKRS
jgi:transposase